jgi:tetratricopeptide (TPR) repeat protein
MSFETLIADATAALKRAAFDEARALLDRANACASSESDRALAAIHRASIPVLEVRRDVEWNVFRENIVRRHSPKHVQLAAYYLVISAVDRNDRETATRYLPILLDAARELNDPMILLMSYDVAAGVESINGNHIAAIEYGRVAWSEAQAYRGDDADLTRAGIAHHLAYNSLAANEYAEALEYIEIALPHAERTANPHVLRQCLVTASFVYLLRDQLGEAAAFADRAAPLANGTRLEHYVHYVRGEVARRRGNRAEAAAHFRKLEKLYPDIPRVAEMLLSMNFAPFLMPE